MEDLVTHIKDLGLYLESNREPLKDSKLIRLRKILSGSTMEDKWGMGIKTRGGKPTAVILEGDHGGLTLV